MIYLKRFSAALLMSFLGTACTAQAEKAEDTYKKNCASCHGNKMQGGLGGALLGKSWKYGGTDADIAQVITNGIAEKGMPAWKSALSDEDIRALIIYMREVGAKTNSDAQLKSLQPTEGVFSTKHHKFKLEKLVGGFGVLWALDFLSDGSMLVSERDGILWRIKAGEKAKVMGTPKVWANTQGGLLDIAVKQDDGNNPWVYLSYSQPSSNGAMTAVVRGKIKNNQFVDSQIIFQADEKFHTQKGYHFGSRIVLDKGYIFFSVGDRGDQQQAQDLSRPNGKIHRLFDDGRTPEDNPFVKTPEAIKSIWSYGSRNPQGMVLSHNGLLWETEHGPRGGDEVNIIEKGVNYGWPSITYGMNYDGTAITNKTSAPGMAQPKHYWVPSIAVTAIDEYSGSAFPSWSHHLLVGSLAKQELQLLEVKGTEVMSSELLLKNQGRIRDLVVGSDGLIYLAMNPDGEKGSAIYRLVPAAKM